MNVTKQLFRLLMVAVMISLIASASIGFRVRPDKKAMRNSLVRFGKRADSPSMEFEGPLEPVYVDNAGYPYPEKFYFRRFQEFN